jgi:hypothetical protein
LCEFMGVMPTSMLLGIVEVTWCLSRSEDCSRDASIVHDLALASRAGPYRATATRWLDYKVGQAGWVPVVPYIVGSIAQAVQDNGLCIERNILIICFLDIRFRVSGTGLEAGGRRGEAPPPLGS